MKPVPLFICDQVFILCLSLANANSVVLILDLTLIPACLVISLTTTMLPNLTTLRNYSKHTDKTVTFMFQGFFSIRQFYNFYFLLLWSINFVPFYSYFLMKKECCIIRTQSFNKSLGDFHSHSLSHFYYVSGCDININAQLS